MAESEIQERAAFSAIRYAQCWEDPLILSQALMTGPGDVVVSIASAGDNSLALLLDEPKTVIALDLSEPQIALCELKAAAIAELSWEEFAMLMGARRGGDRRELYEMVKGQMTPLARSYWDAHLEVIAAGVIHSGKFERYFALFRRWVLPLIHRRKVVAALLEGRESAARERFYAERWNNRRWRWLFRVFFGRFLLGRLGRDPAFFEYMGEGGVAGRLMDRVRHALTAIPVAENWFLEYILTGAYARLETAHPYLRPGNFLRLKGALDRFELHSVSLEGYLSEHPDVAPTRYNLSDIFEYMSAEAHEAILDTILARSPPGTRLAYWNLFVPRERPARYGDRIAVEQDLAHRLWLEDKAFFYSRFVVESVV